MESPVVPNTVPALLDPSRSCLLFVDFDGIDHPDCPEITPPEITATHAAILDAAKRHTVPSYLTSLTCRRARRQRKALADLFLPDASIIRHTVNPWLDSALQSAIGRHQRSCLLLAGGWLEGSLLQLALSALVDGYDVHVIIDLTADADSPAGAVALQRMVQAGVVPVTTCQVMLEWGATEDGTPTQASLASIG